MTPEILQYAILALAGWNLRETIRLGRLLERHDQAIKDLPCESCGEVTIKKTNT